MNSVELTSDLTVENQENGAPCFVQSFMQLGSGQYILPKPAVLETDRAQILDVLEITNLNTRENIVSSQVNESQPRQHIKTSPNVWDYLKSAAQRFRSNLKELLIDDIRGREFLYTYYNLKKIDQSLISRIIIESELKDNPDKRISRSSFLDWAHDLVILIPTSNVELWYRPYNGSTGMNGQGQSAGGVLYEKYNNMRKTYRKIGLLETKKKKCPASNISPPLGIIDQIRWLENNDELREEVVSKWSTTPSHRFDIIETVGIQIYFEKFKALKRAGGYILLDMDFDSLYPGCKDKLFTTWSRTAEGLFYVAKKSTSPEVLNFSHTHREMIDRGNIEVLGFLLLPLLLGSVTVKKLTGNRKPSRVEIQNLFILHVETLENLQPILQAGTERLVASAQTIQPFPTLIGLIDNLVSARVTINTVEYDVCSAIKAVDSCFKSFFALHAKYQAETSHCWAFIENYVYGINRKSKKYACVNKLICSLNAYFANHES